MVKIRRNTADVTLAKNAIKMRREPTEPEKRLWRAISNSQLGGHKFRRQSVIDTFIVDFFCPQKNLVVEVDGETHSYDTDQKRDAALLRFGVTVLHVTNDDVMKNIEGVLMLILKSVESQSSRWPHPNPSPEGEGLL